MHKGFIKLFSFNPEIVKWNVFILVLMISSSANSQTINKNALNFFSKGTQKVKIKDYSGAIEDFTNAVNADPGFKQAFENRGVAKFYLQDFEGAISDYSKALEIDPKDYSTHGRRGWAKFYLHDYAGAVSDLDIAVKGSKDRYRYLNFRGEAKLRLHDIDGATADFTKVIGSLSAGREQKGKAYYWRGMISISKGNKESGCQDLKKAARAEYPIAENAIEENCNK